MARPMHAYVGIGLSCITMAGSVYVSNNADRIMRELPQEAARYLPSHRNVINKSHINHLRRKGYVVIDNAISSKELFDAREDIFKMYDKKIFDNAENDEEYRKDKVTWIHENIEGQLTTSRLANGLLHVLRICRNLPLEIVNLNYCTSEELGVPLINQLAIYDGKYKGYKAHRDLPEQNVGFTHPLQPILLGSLLDRKLTIILYLNENWNSEKGGELRIFLDTEMSDVTGSTTKYIDIAPLGGRIVIFDSASILHEVRPTLQDDCKRLALTLWAGGDSSSSEFYKNFRVLFIETKKIDLIYVKDKLWSMLFAP